MANAKTSQKEFQRLGGRGVPLIIIGNERMEGYNPQWLDATINATGP